MLAHQLQRLCAAGSAAADAIRRCLMSITRSAVAPLITGTLADVARSRSALIAENALLRQQLIIVRRSITRPRCIPVDRVLL